MRIYPAIDLRGGRCVRLRQGDPERETVYGDDPVAVARRWAAAGARALHVVDLDGAFAGTPRQREVIAAICGAVAIPVQAGGGLRTLADVDALLAAGAACAVVGTRALSREFAEVAVGHYGERLLPALDARDGVVALQGWRRDSGVALEDAAAVLAAAGARRVLYTDVGRDGMLGGPDLAGVAMLREVGLGVIASGGVARAADVTALAAAGAEGVVIGRALYDGRIELGEALAAASGA